MEGVLQILVRVPTWGISAKIHTRALLALKLSRALCILPCCLCCIQDICNGITKAKG